MAVPPAGMFVVSIPNRDGVARNMRAPTGAARSAWQEPKRLSMLAESAEVWLL